MFADLGSHHPARGLQTLEGTQKGDGCWGLGSAQVPGPRIGEEHVPPAAARSPAGFASHSATEDCVAPAAGFLL